MPGAGLEGSIETGGSRAADARLVRALGDLRETLWGAGSSTRKLAEAAPAFLAEWRRSRRRTYVACDSVHVVMAVFLWFQGYPARWFGWYAVGLVAQLLAHVVAETPWARAREERGQDQVRRWAERVWQVAMLIEIAATGGVRSPFFPSNIAGVPFSLQLDRSREAVASACITVACAVTFALSPVGWWGPSVQPSAYWVTLSLAVVVTSGYFILTSMLLQRVAIDSLQDALHAREALVEQATIRARELEQLGGRISHELKNPLSAIKTLVQVSARAAQDRDSRERLEVVEREVKRIERTLAEHLQISRPLERIEYAPTSVGALVDELISVVSATAAESGVTVLRRGDVLAELDPARMGEALLNLVMNALQASRHGAQVWIDIAERDGAAVIAVEDRGVGMPAEVLARVGTPFFTTRVEGTGLGVVHARAVFEMHRGRLEFSSVPGEGTVATGTLPLAAPRRDDGPDPGRR